MNTFKRFFSIASLLIPPFTIYFLTKSNPSSKRFQKTIVTIREHFQLLGTTFIKLGQMLSSRPDIVGPELSAELRNLLDHEQPIPFAQVQKILSEELHANGDAVFEQIDETPIATASIAQVHKARLTKRKIVAVKVQRPGITEVIHSDLPVLKMVASLLDVLAIGKQIKFSYIYQQFEDWITNELDFQVEGRRADKFRENMKSVEGIVIPEVYWKYTTKKILVMQFLDGPTLNQLLDDMKKQQVTSLYDLKITPKINPDTLIHHTIAAVAKQALSDRYFHGDLHPANLIILKQNKVALVDFGIVGTLDNQEYMELVFTMLALVENDPESLLKAILSLITQQLTKEQTGDIQEVLSLELHKLHEDTGGQISLNHFITTMMSVAQKYDMLWTPGVLLALKTIGQIDFVAGQIGLREPLVDLMKPEVEKYILKALSSTMSKEELFKEMLNLFQAGKRLPDTLTDLEQVIQSSKLLVPSVPTATPHPLSPFMPVTVSLLISFPLFTMTPLAASAYKPVLVIAVPLLLYTILSKIMSKGRG